jgi:hypothetical protein
VIDPLAAPDWFDEMAPRWLSRDRGESARLADKGEMHGGSKSATARKIMYTCSPGTIVDERLGVGLWLPSPKGC